MNPFPSPDKLVSSKDPKASPTPLQEESELTTSNALAFKRIPEELAPALPRTGPHAASELPSNSQAHDLIAMEIDAAASSMKTSTSSSGEKSSFSPFIFHGAGGTLIPKSRHFSARHGHHPILFREVAQISSPIAERGDPTQEQQRQNGEGRRDWTTLKSQLKGSRPAGSPPTKSHSVIRPNPAQPPQKLILLSIPEAREAIGFDHNPKLGLVRPVGQNGLDLDSIKPIKPALLAPMDCDSASFAMWESATNILNLQHHALTGRRLAAYRSDSGDIFDAQEPRNRLRLRRVEECWNKGQAAMNLETAYWNACYERMRYAHKFSHRDNYLRLENAAEFAAKMLNSQSERDINLEIFARCYTTDWNPFEKCKYVIKPWNYALAIDSLVAEQKRAFKEDKEMNDIVGRMAGMGIQKLKLAHTEISKSEGMFKLSPAQPSQSVGIHDLNLASTEVAQSEPTIKPTPSKQSIDSLVFKRAVGEVPPSQRIFKPLQQRIWPSFGITKPTHFTFGCSKPSFIFTVPPPSIPASSINQPNQDLSESRTSKQSVEFNDAGKYLHAYAESVDDESEGPTESNDVYEELNGTLSDPLELSLDDVMDTEEGIVDNHRDDATKEPVDRGMNEEITNATEELAKDPTDESTDETAEELVDELANEPIQAEPEKSVFEEPPEEAAINDTLPALEDKSEDSFDTASEELHQLEELDLKESPEIIVETLTIQPLEQKQDAAVAQDGTTDLEDTLSHEEVPSLEEAQELEEPVKKEILDATEERMGGLG